MGEYYEDVWGDFCAVFGVDSLIPAKVVYEQTNSENVWFKGEFIEKTFVENMQDLRLIISLQSDLQRALQELRILKTSKSWRLTKPLRLFFRLILKIKGNFNPVLSAD